MLASGLKPKQSNLQRNPWCWIPSLYMIEGLPNALVVTMSMLLYKDMGLDNASITAYTSLFYLPWVIKPFWSPFIDIFSTKRRWIVAMQLAMAVCVGTIAMVLSTPMWLAVSLAAFWMLALSSATHDIAADGFYMLALSKEKQDFFVGIRSTFYRLAGLLVAGGLVMLVGKLMRRGYAPAQAWQAVVGILAAIFAVAVTWHLFSLPHPISDKPNVATSARRVAEELGQSFKSFFAQKHILISLAFLLFFRIPESLQAKLVTNFLKDPIAQGGLGLDNVQIGIVTGTSGVIAGIVGGIVGGIIMSRYGLRKCIWPMALALTVPSSLYYFLAVYQPSNFLFLNVGIAFEQFGYMFGYTAMMVYMLRITEGSRYATSHFAFCTGIAFLGLMIPGLFAGQLQMHFGYSAAFAVVIALSALTYAVTYMVYRHLK